MLKNVWGRAARGTIAQQLLARGRPAAHNTDAPGMTLQGASARERRQAKPLEQQQHSEQGVAPFFALESGRPDFWKIRSTLFWALVLRIRA